MASLQELELQLITFTEALDRIADKLAVATDKLVKTTLIKQYEEMAKLRTGIEVKIKELEIQMPNQI